MTEAKTDPCLKCGQWGHTSSSCKRVQCVACDGFRMTAKGVLQKCVSKSSAWSPSPTFWRECGRFSKVKPEIETKRREALRAQGSVTA